jgi:hypothetical protein
MLETKGLELREKDMAQSNAKDIAELSLKKQELDIRKRGQDIEAARDIGANTIRSKEADNKKDIMLQKFLLDGLEKMRDINPSQETKGFAKGGAAEIKGYKPGGMVTVDDMIALINSYGSNPTTDEPSMTLFEDVQSLPEVETLSPTDASMFEAMQSLPEVEPLSPTDASMFEAMQSLPEVKPTAPQSTTSEEVTPTFTPTVAPIMFEFLRDVEGFETSGYVPEDEQGNPIENSGVTIATGLDLGQQDEDSLRRMGLSEELISIFRPYLGLRRGEAQRFLLENPLTLSEEQARFVEESLMYHDFYRMADLWNSTQREQDGIRWDQLDPEKQTVLLSVFRQYGNIPKRTPKFWRAASQGRWDDVLSELRDFGDDYKTRRNKEADLLQASF